MCKNRTTVVGIAGSVGDGYTLSIQGLQETFAEPYSLAVRSDGQKTVKDLIFVPPQKTPSWKSRDFLMGGYHNNVRFSHKSS